MSGFRHILSKVNRKKLLEENVLETPLERCLTTLDLTLLGIGSMVGSGLFVLTGEVARNTAGPSVSVSYFIAGIAALLAAICYAEFGTRIPKAGSAYIFAYVTVGEIWAFLVGWNILLEYVVGAAATAKAFSGYFDDLTGNYINSFIIDTLLGGEEWSSDVFSDFPDILAALLILILVILVASGAALSTKLNSICVVISLGLVIFMFIASMFYADVSNWSAGDGYLAYGFGGTLSGAATCFYAYLGFEVIAVTGEEAKTPAKSIPLATIYAFIVSASAYILASIGLTLMIPYTDIDPTSAFSAAFEYVGLDWAKYIVGIGAVLAILTSAFGNIFPLPRSLYAISSDGLIFKVFARVNPRTKVPIFGVVLFGLFAAVLALVFDLDALVEFLSIGTLCGFSFVAASVIIVRYSPELCNISIKNPRGCKRLSYNMSDVSNHLEEVRNNWQDIDVDNKEALTGRLKEPFRCFDFLENPVPGDTVLYSLIISVLCQFTAIVFAVYAEESLAERKWWAILFVIMFGTLALLAFLVIPMHHQSEVELDFKVPFVPYLPAGSILLNLFLMAELDSYTWLRFIIWIIDY
ncbi:cationic amino acid transporter 4-like isoform X2 [Anneissia japonica]|uniref:cationic amino acid transporter 4-like isoform X2 n=1 Tax=Anneissia japonica TaxID=1529436 RepID=UPI0014259CDF|nr:cationic amino acid transporter 4-like isoform X2 [Anneissia japonica]